LRGDKRAIFIAASHARDSTDYPHRLQPTVAKSSVEKADERRFARFSRASDTKDRALHTSPALLATCSVG
jgi:hypothetical protein